MTITSIGRQDAVYIKNVPRKGRGLFANVPFRANAVIERSTTWGFSRSEETLLRRTGLFEYYFVRPETNNRLIAGYVVFGTISVVNHSFSPNAEIVWDDDETGAWISIIALKDIDIDEEITHFYANINEYSNSNEFVA
ncbi:SET domain-containing protein-lysine N-methyltransferase [Mesorhizobium sp. Cs1299R1N1]|uniref:SET domain-containing protein-lysine N-methyltransferase n=1 Tax=Mesorhizobium sp. Cs1299R1N1 TaxID=3015172 RepID=UPI003FA5B691